MAIIRSVSCQQTDIDAVICLTAPVCTLQSVATKASQTEIDAVGMLTCSHFSCSCGKMFIASVTMLLVTHMCDTRAIFLASVLRATSSMVPKPASTRALSSR